MAENRHIERIQDTEANVKANLDPGQSAILTDQNEEWVYYNDDGSKLYYVANQKYWNGAAYTYCDVEFNDVTAYGDIYVGEYIYHQGDTDTYGRYRDDRFTRVVGGVTMADYVEDGSQDYIEFDPDEADVDFIVNTVVADTIFAEGDTGRVWIQKAASGGTAQADADTFVVEEAADGGISIIVSDGNVARLAMGDATDTDFFEFQADQDNGTVIWEQAGAEILRVAAGLVTWNNDGDDRDMKFEGDTLGNLLYLNAGLDAAGVGTNTPDARLHAEHSSTDTNTVREVFRITHVAASPTDGFGVRMGFEIENSTQGTPYVAGAIDVLWEDDSAGDSDMVFNTMDGWSLSEVGRLTSVGHRRWSSAPITWDVNQEAAFAIVDGVYNTIAPVSATCGGALFSGYNKGNANAATAVWLDAYVENNPDDNGAINLRARKHDGAGGLEALSAAAHVFTVENSASTVIAVHGDGATELLAAAGLYFGLQGANDTWRIIRSGNDLDFDRREAGAYVTKFTVTAA